MSDNTETTPFPSNAEMDLDMWKASPHVMDDGSRTIFSVADDEICKVYGAGHLDPDRDTNCRRIEMVGDVYEELRKLAERAKAAGLDVTQAEITLNEFIAPKPFAEVV